MVTPTRLSLSPSAGTAALSSDRRRLIDLAARIAQARAALEAWRDNLALHESAYVRSVVPLIRRLIAARRETVLRFDRLADEPGWNQAERSALREHLSAGAAELLDSGGADDPTLRALLAKHSAAPRSSGIGAAAPPAPPEPGRAQRSKPPAKWVANPAPAPAEHSLRDLFRRLASALHPDRETDPVQRERKTALMQQANVAYAGRDLLSLLELQAQTKPADDLEPSRVERLNADEMARHSAALSARLAALQAEVDRAEAGFRSDFGLPPGRGMNPARLVRTVRQEARDLRADIEAQQAFLRMLDDPGAVKAWMRRERRRPRRDLADAAQAAR